MDVIGDKSFKFKKFFEQIPTGHHFLLLPGHIDDELFIYYCTNSLAELDNVPLGSIDLGKIAPYLYKHYEVRTFHGNERLNIGPADRSKRVCRFCGRSMPEVSFKEKAHAISESLGNKGLVCREECDDCNHRLNETIEQDVTRILQFFLILKGIKGKNGNPTLQGDGISFTNDSSSRARIGRDTLILKVKELPDTHDPQAIAKFMSELFSSVSIKYVPQNIYKCFCKYVLSLIDREQLSYFKGTIDWINEPLSKHWLPPVWHYEVPMRDEPTVIIMQRKHNYKDIPYCWAILSIAGQQFLFIIPFCSLDKFKFIGKSRIDFFLNGLRNFMPNVSFNPIKFNSVKPAKFKITANFEISPDCVEGRDYYFFNPNKKPKI